MLGDAVEFGQWKTRVRQESFVFSGGSVGTKVGMGASQAIITAYMTYSGYLASTGATLVQPQSALNAIVNIYLIGPILVWLIVLVVCWFYRLDDKYPSIMEELFERENAANYKNRAPLYDSLDQFSLVYNRGSVLRDASFRMLYSASLLIRVSRNYR